MVTRMLRRPFPALAAFILALGLVLCAFGCKEPQPEKAKGESAALPADVDPAHLALIRKIIDKKGRVDNTAASELKIIGRPAVPALLFALKDKAPAMRFNAAIGLRHLKDEIGDRLPELTRNLADPDNRVVQVVGALLKDFGDKGVEILVAAVRDDDPKIRLGGLSQLKTLLLKNPLAMSGLITALEDDERKIRYEAVKTAIGLGAAAAPASKTLAALLDDPVEVVRFHAAVALGNIGPGAAEAVPALKDHLEGETFMRLACSFALQRIAPGTEDSKESIPNLMLLLMDKQEKIRTDAANALAGIGRDALPSLEEGLANNEELIRAGSAAAIGKMDIPANKSMPLLIERLGDDSPVVRKSASRAISGIGEQAEKELMAAADNPNPKIRIGALLSLVHINPGKDAYLPVLRKGASDGNSTVRHGALTALSALGAGGAQQALPELLAALADKNDNIKASAAFALGRIGFEAGNGTTELAALLSDSNQTVRLEAARALGRIGPEGAKAAPALSKLLDGPDPLSRAAALDALGEMGPAAAIAAPAVEKKLSAPDKKIALRAAAALARIDPEPAQAERIVSSLLKELESPDSETRRLAARALGRIPQAGPEVLPPLVKILADKDPLVQTAAAWAIAAVAPGSTEAGLVIPMLTEGLSDRSPAVRNMATQALGFIGPEAETAIPNLLANLLEGSLSTREASAWALYRINPKTRPRIPLWLVKQLPELARVMERNLRKPNPKED